MTQRIQLTYMYDVLCDELGQCFDEHLLAHLSVHTIRVALALRDYSVERADLVRRLNRARIPVVAWLVHPEHDFRLHDAEAVQTRFDAFQQWSTQHGLSWDAVAIDIEPDMRDTVRFGDEPTVDLAALIRRVGDRWHIEAATTAYTHVVAHMRAAGFVVELFEIPFVRDDRVSGTTIARRLLGLPDVVADRTVMQLQSSYVRPYGPGLIAAYAPEASSVMLGSLRADTHNRALSEDELLRDLAHVTACGITHIYIADMQVVRMSAAIADKLWVSKVLPAPDEYYQQVARMRAGVRALLWAGARPAVLLPLLIPVLLLVRRMLRTQQSAS